MQDKSRILYVLRYLEEKSDEQHPVTINQILEQLEILGIKANRRTISDDIEQLEKFGVDIVTVRSTQNQYFIGERHFQIPELKLLIDAVLSSKLVTPKKSSELIEKLKKLASEHQMAEFAEEFQVDGRIKPKNESVFLIADTISVAISKDKQISFQYYEFMPDKTKILKNDGYIYKLSPYKLVWSEDRYYCLGYSTKHNKIATFRVDRMCQVKIISAKATPCPSDFVIADYLGQVFEMYDGKNAEVSLKCKAELMKVIIDKFGEEIHTDVIDNEWFKVTVQVIISPTFYGWLFQFTDKMIIVSPENIIDEYAKILINATKNLCLKK